jgi:hypothetical protein
MSGKFQVDTAHVPVIAGEANFTCLAAVLPDFLQAAIGVFNSGIEGILGNEIMREQRVGYFPRRGILLV